MTKDLFEYQYELLLKEMDILQENIRGYDSIIFTIKGWSITVFSAFLFFVAQQREAQYLLLAAFAVVLFWSLDAVYKSFQRRFIIRYVAIEEFLRTKLPSAVTERHLALAVPHVRAQFAKGEPKSHISTWRSATTWHTSILYLSMLGMLVIMFLLGWLAGVF